MTTMFLILLVFVVALVAVTVLGWLAVYATTTARRVGAGLAALAIATLLLAAAPLLAEWAVRQ